MFSLLGTIGCSRAPAVQPAATPARAVEEAMLAGAPDVRSQHGMVSVDLGAAIDPETGAPAFVYRGVAGVAPTIRVWPGDELRIRLHNALPSGTDAPNDVNLHFHGLTVSPNAPSDDAMRVAHPGETITYDVHVPRTQPPGLYWYHPHAHGQTYWQITSGMSGALVVEGLQKHLPALAGLRERVIVLRNVQSPPDFTSIPIAARPPAIRAAVLAGRRRAGRLTAVDDDDAVGEPCLPTPGMLVTINGAPRAIVGIDPHERQLFRVVNASAGRYFDLSIDGQSLDVLALDGVPLDAYPGSAPVQRVRDIVIAPAGRAEFLVTGNAKPTKLRSNCYVTGEAGDRDPPVILADLRPDGRAPAGSKRERPIIAATKLAGTTNSAGVPAPVTNRTVTFTENAGGFYINGKAYRMLDAPAFVARAGTMERWTLVNRTDEVHDFHIHQIHFAVESTDGRPEEPMHWVDTVTVPPMHYTHSGGTPGTAVVLMDFRNPVVRGTFVFHCHILDHEDGGMMAAIRVI